MIDLDGQVEHLEDALEADDGGGELDRGVGEVLKGAVEDAEVGAEGDDGADGDAALDDLVAAEAIDEGGADGAEEADDDEEDGAEEGTLDTEIAHIGRARSEALGLGTLAAEELDEEGAADVEGFVDDGVHAGVGVHLSAGGIAQARAEQAGGVDEEGHDGDAGEGEAPFDGEHHGEDDDGLDEVGDDADDGVADGVLGADDVVVKAADHLAGFGAGEEAQGHAQ